jgi:hypothetical protein
MLQASRYQLNENHVVYQEYYEEILAINLDKGIYFSLRGSAAQIWSLILQGATVAAIVDSLSDKYDPQRNHVPDEVERFIADLLGHELIAPHEAQVADTSVVATIPEKHDLPSFDSPTIEIYTDMQELLLLDPVHDADEAGWPVQKEDAPGLKG